VNHQTNILLFSVIFGVFLFVLDLYTIGRFTQFVRKSNKSKWLYRSTWSLAAIIGCLYWFVAYRRHMFRLDGIDVILFSIISLWYLPKVLIVVVLLMRDVIRAAVWLAKKITGTVKAPTVATEATTFSEADGIVHVRSAGESRRDFLKSVGWSAAAVPYVIVGNGMFRTLYDFQVQHHEIVLDNLPRSLDGFVLVQVSDIHAGSFPDEKPFREVVRLVNSYKADAVVITGDFVNAVPEELALVSAGLTKLRGEYGVFGSLGNHDHYNSLTQHKQLISGVKRFGVDLLVNENRVINVGADRLVIAGTDNTGFNQKFANLDKALQDVTREDATILLAHDPTFWDLDIVGKTDVDLMLAGHTHGGQFGVSLMGFEWSPAKLIYKQWAGLYKNGNQQLYVNRGIGTVGPPMRIGIRPEITVFTLRAASIDQNYS